MYVCLTQGGGAVKYNVTVRGKGKVEPVCVCGSVCGSVCVCECV